MFLWRSSSFETKRKGEHLFIEAKGAQQDKNCFVICYVALHSVGSTTTNLCQRVCFSITYSTSLGYETKFNAENKWINHFLKKIICSCCGIPSRKTTCLNNQSKGSWLFNTLLLTLLTAAGTSHLRSVSDFDNDGRKPINLFHTLHFDHPPSPPCPHTIRTKWPQEVIKPDPLSRDIWNHYIINYCRAQTLARPSRSPSITSFEMHVRVFMSWRLRQRHR